MPTQSYNIGNTIFDNNGGNRNVIADYAYISNLLANIPDNNTNQIDAKDVRDAVWTLWNRIDDIVIGLSSSGIDIGASPSSASFSADLRYDRERLSSAAPVGGVPTGSTFSGTIQDVLDRIFYPYTPPTCSLSGGGDRQFGSDTAVTLSFTLNKFEKPITAASIQLLSGTTMITPIPSVITQNNTIPATFGPSTLSTTPASIVTFATHSANPGTSFPNTYTLTVGDGKATSQSSTTVTWKNYLYYGTLNLSTLAGNPNPDLTARPDGSNSAAVASSIIQISNLITSNTLKAAPGSNNRVLATKVFATTRSLSLSDYAAGGNYLFFAWPTAFGTPTFKINGLSNSAFTKVKSNFVFTNESNFSGVNYDVWISNTAYGTSTINIS